MIVLDASAAIDFLLEVPDRGAWAGARILRVPEVHVPQLFDFEVLSVLRDWVGRRKIGEERGRAALLDVDSMRIVRYPARSLRDRIWTLRENLTAFDASYIALAEALAMPLVTTDARLARAPGHRALVEAFPG